MTRCFWCGSSETHFHHFDCWEEDQVGNQIEVDSFEEARRKDVTPKDEVWWCNVCEGYFAWPVEDEEPDDVTEE